MLTPVVEYCVLKCPRSLLNISSRWACFWFPPSNHITPLNLVSLLPQNWNNKIWSVDMIKVLKSVLILCTIFHNHFTMVPKSMLLLLVDFITTTVSLASCLSKNGPYFSVHCNACWGVDIPFTFTFYCSIRKESVWRLHLCLQCFQTRAIGFLSVCANEVRENPFIYFGRLRFPKPSEFALNDPITFLLFIPGSLSSALFCYYLIFHFF